MNDREQLKKDIKARLDEIQRRRDGGGPIQKQIMLLKLTDLYENRPENFGQYQIAAGSPEREWLSAVGALIKKYDPVFYGTAFDSKMQFLNQYGNASEIVGLVRDVIEAIKLELELDGRDQIGNAYAPGEYYDYFRDLKEIIDRATSQLFVIDPYFDGKAFDAYLSEVPNQVEVRILADRYSSDVNAYAERHSNQYGTKIELRQSKELHDRLIFVDQADCWITGGSVKDAGKKAAYLIPAQPMIGEKKLIIYTEVWDRSQPLS